MLTSFNLRDLAANRTLNADALQLTTEETLQELEQLAQSARASGISPDVLLMSGKMHFHLQPYIAVSARIERQRARRKRQRRAQQRRHQRASLRGRGRLPA